MPSYCDEPSDSLSLVLVHVASILIFFILAVHALRRLLTLWKQQAGNTGWQQLFYALLTLSASLRVFQWSLDITFILLSYIPPRAVGFAPYILPSFSFMSAYVILLLFWVELIRGADGSFISKQNGILFKRGNIAMYSVVFLLEVADLLLCFTDEDGCQAQDHSRFGNGLSELETALVFLVALCYSLLAVGFCFYGWKLFRQVSAVERVAYHNASEMSAEKNAVLWQVGCLAVLITGIMVFKTVLTVFSVTVERHTVLGPDPDCWWEVAMVSGYLVVVEVLPTFLILYLLKRSQPARAGPYPPLKSHAIA